MPQSYHLRIGNLLSNLLMVCLAKKIDVYFSLFALLKHPLAQQNALSGHAVGKRKNCGVRFPALSAGAAPAWSNI